MATPKTILKTQNGNYKILTELDQVSFNRITLTYNSTLPATFEAGTSLVSASRAPRIGWDIS